MKFVATLLAAILLVCIGCHSPSQHEELRRDAIRRLRAQIKEQCAIDERIAGLHGQAADEVLKQLGKPSAAQPCTDAQQCWYYRLSGRQYFVCLNQQGTVTCEGTTNRLRPPN